MDAYLAGSRLPVERARAAWARQYPPGTGSPPAIATIAITACTPTILRRTAAARPTLARNRPPPTIYRPTSVGLRPHAFCLRCTAPPERVERGATEMIVVMRAGAD